MSDSLTEHIGDIVGVNIRNIAVGGSGVGEVVSQPDEKTNLLGITAFVPFTAVGEQVRARITQQKARYLTADLVMVETPSPERVIPRCPYFTVCGGCELQHLSYPGQLAAKLEMIRGALRVAGFKTQIIECVRDVAEGPPFEYRSRITLHVDSGGRVGFYRSNSRSLVEIDHCPISSPAINQVLPAVREYSRDTAGVISGIVLEADDDGVVAVVKCAYRLNRGAVESLIQKTKLVFESASFLVDDTEIGGYGRKVLNLPTHPSAHQKLSVPAGSFSQVNREINFKLVKYAVNSCRPTSDKVIYDLYAGAGNFALPLAKTGASVTAVECNSRLAAFGRENAHAWGLDRRLSFIESSVERFLKTGPKLRPAEVVLADPPRSGLGKVVQNLPKCSRLVLISCHLPSCVRDLKNLLQQDWTIEELQPFDMFAQTSYTEIVSVLSR